MNRKTMLKRHAVSGTEAECFVTIDGSRYLYASIYKFKAEIKVSLTAIPILGRRMEAHKAGKMSGSFSGTAHFNSSVLRDVMRRYKETGFMPEMEIQVSNEDETSEVGRQTVILKGVLFEGLVLTQFDEGAEFLEEEIKGTFDDFEIPDKFKLMGGEI